MKEREITSSKIIKGEIVRCVCLCVCVRGHKEPVSRLRRVVGVCCICAKGGSVFVSVDMTCFHFLFPFLFPSPGPSCM